MSRPALSTPPDGYVRVGRLGRSFKLDGGVRLLVESDLDDEELAELLASTPRLFVAGLGESRLRGSDTRTGSLVVHLEGVRDRTAARSLVNAGVWALVEDLPDEINEVLEGPSPEETLTGLPVRVDGEVRGEIVGVYLNDVNPYVEVRLPAGDVALVPLTAPYVELSEEGLDLTEPPEGLLT